MVPRESFSPAHGAAAHVRERGASAAAQSMQGEGATTVFERARFGSGSFSGGSESLSDSPWRGRVASSCFLATDDVEMGGQSASIDEFMVDDEEMIKHVPTEMWLLGKDGFNRRCVECRHSAIDVYVVCDNNGKLGSPVDCEKDERRLCCRWASFSHNERLALMSEAGGFDGAYTCVPCLREEVSRSCAPRGEGPSSFSRA